MSHKKIKPESFKPEKWVQNEILAWCFLHGWSMDVFDSKSLKIDGKMKSNPGLPVGTSDLVGNTDQGLSAYVELKKVGYRHVCRLAQRQFLERKIGANGFGLVTDSAIHLEETYLKFLSLRSKSLNEARDFLMLELPRKVLIEGKILLLV